MTFGSARVDVSQSSSTSFAAILQPMTILLELMTDYLIVIDLMSLVPFLII